MGKHHGPVFDIRTNLNVTEHDNGDYVGRHREDIAEWNAVFMNCRFCLDKLSEPAAKVPVPGGRYYNQPYL